MKTTYSASTVTGGTSVNSIPNTIAMEFDKRSASTTNLKAVETQFLKIINGSVAAENAACDTRYGKISATPELIGDRPAGTTPATDPLVLTAERILKAGDYDAQLMRSSTDSNIPRSASVSPPSLCAAAASAPTHWISM